MTLREFANLVYDVLGNIKIEHFIFVFTVLLLIQLPHALKRCIVSPSRRIERKKVLRGDYDEQ